jgi:toxin FitB
MFLLDTNVISELRREQLAHPNVALWAGSKFADDLFLSAITIMEIELGCLRLERRDPRQGKALRDWLENYVLDHFQGRILSIDTAIARQCARLHVPDPKPERDSMIAATALVHEITLVTRNTKDFARTGARIINPWL